MFIQYKRQVDFSRNIIDANLGYDGLITYAKCKGALPTNPNKFQEGCIIAKIDSVNNSTELYYNAGIPSAPIWEPLGGSGSSVTINAPFPGIAIATNGTTIGSVAYGANGTVLTMVAGLPVFSPIPSGESTTVSDTNSIDLTITGTDITADLKLSATTPNIATVVGDGLLVQETVTTLAQASATGVITFTAEDASTSTANVVSTDADNSITVGTDGGAFYNAPAIVTSATWDDATNTIDITFDDASVVSVPIIDNIATFLSDFTISDGTTTDVIANHETLTFVHSFGITQVVSANTLTTAVSLSADAGNNLSFGTDNGLFLDVASVLPTKTAEYFDAFSGSTVSLSSTPIFIYAVMKNGQVLREGATRDYTVSGADIILNVPAVSDDMHIVYEY